MVRSLTAQASKLRVSEALVLLPDQSPGLYGNSARLALALALQMLEHGCSWPENLAATGDLDQQERIQAVQGLAEKLEAAVCDPLIQAVLIPAQGVPSLPRSPQDMFLLPCQNLDEALLLMDWLGLGLPAARVKFWRSCLGSAELCAKHLAEIPSICQRSESALS